MVRDEHLREPVNLLLRAAPHSKVILFGSYARRDARPDSDVDFLVVEPTVTDRMAEMVRLGEVLRPLGIAADILVVSAERFDYWRDTPNTIVHRAVQEGIVYEAVA